MSVRQQVQNMKIPGEGGKALQTLYTHRISGLVAISYRPQLKASPQPQTKAPITRCTLVFVQFLIDVVAGCVSLTQQALVVGDIPLVHLFYLVAHATNQIALNSFVHIPPQLVPPSERWLCVQNKVSMTGLWGRVVVV